MPRIYPIGGGKGGTGKSFLTANLGVLFAKQGKKVVLVDLDLGGSNLHTLLGVRNPKACLSDFLGKTNSDLHEVVLPTAVPNLHLIASTNCSVEIANLFCAQKSKIIRAIEKLPYDCVFLDLGAGIGFNTLDFFLVSNEGLFVLTPEPTSIENTFRFIRAVNLRKMRQLLKQPVFKNVEREIFGKSGERSLRSASSVIDLVIQYDRDKGRLLQSELSELRLRFVLNQFRKHMDTNLGNKIEKVCNKHFLSRFQFLDNIGYDERVHDSIFSKRIYVNTYPHTSIATSLHNIAKKMVHNGENLQMTSYSLC